MFVVAQVDIWLVLRVNNVLECCFFVLLPLRADQMLYTLAIAQGVFKLVS
jgi:hypothetical protein